MFMRMITVDYDKYSKHTNKISGVGGGNGTFYGYSIVIGVL